MDKDDVLPFLKHSFANQIDQARHALARVNRIEQDSFQPGKCLYGIDGSGRRESISLTDIVAIGDHIFPPYGSGRAAQVRGCTGQLEHILFLSIAGCANTDAEQRYSGAYASKPGDQSRLRPGAARCAYDAIDSQAQIIGLRDELDGGIHVAERPGRVRSASGYEIGFAAIAPKPRSNSCKFSIHVGIGRAMLDARTMQMIQQDIAACRVIVVRFAGAILEQDVAIDSHLRGAGSRLARVIGLRCALCQHDVGALISRFRQQVLEFSSLVAAGRHAGAIVTLDPEFRAIERAAQIGHLLERCR